MSRPARWLLAPSAPPSRNPLDRSGRSRELAKLDNNHPNYGESEEQHPHRNEEEHTTGEGMDVPEESALAIVPVPIPEITASHCHHRNAAAQRDGQVFALAQETGDPADGEAGKQP